MLLGEILIEKFGVNRSDVEKALQFQAQFGGLIGSVLLNMGIISEEALVSALAMQLNLPTFKDIAHDQINFAASDHHEDLNIPFLVERQWLPFNHVDGKILFASVNPLAFEVLQYLQDMRVSWDAYLVTESQFRELEGEYKLSQHSADVSGLDVSGMLEGEVEKLRELASEAPIVNLVNSHISRAILRQASDLHFEPYKDMYRVRFRIDGILHDIDFLPLKMHVPIASRIKILAGLDIAERRRPQDGQISMKVAAKDVDIRVSTLPLAEGESLVLRFLIKEDVGYELGYLGLEKDLVGMLTEDIAQTAGVILLTGPTGSGKTTTLYSCLNTINDENKKIITIEDPVEYQLDGINQIQVQTNIGYDFLAALRSILRQDPDVIMIGEIRDAETARVAMQSSLTGHLVFSTVHTNDAPTAFTRLIDLGVEEFLINSSLISVIAQRLIRRICTECSTPDDSEPALIKSHGLDSLAERFGIRNIGLRKANACEACSHTGYQGRVGIMEYLRCTPEIQDIRKDSTFPKRARAQMTKNNIRTLKEDGLLKAIQGMTTIDEVFRVCG